MPETTREPWRVKSMPALLALARAMEQEAVAGYLALAERMRTQNRPELAAVFDALTAEEKGHLANVDTWLGEIGGAVPAAAVPAPEALFDDEGASIVAPELLSSYRAFSMAVRNEERAFVFWTYVAAHAPSDEIRTAAERMAREELGHVATLRRERRRAFHDLRRSEPATVKGDLPTLELRLAGHIERMVGAPGTAGAERLAALAGEARARAAATTSAPFIDTPLLESPPGRIFAQAVPLCEYLLDCYLDLAEREEGEQARNRAQIFAAGLIECLQVVRAIPPVEASTDG